MKKSLLLNHVLMFLVTLCFINLQTVHSQVPRTLTVFIHGHDPGMDEWQKHGQDLLNRIGQNGKQGKLLRFNHPDNLKQWKHINHKGFHPNIDDNPDGFNTVLVWDWDDLSTNGANGQAAQSLIIGTEGSHGTRTSSRALLAELLKGHRDGWWSLLSDGKSGDQENKLHIIGFSRGTVVTSELMEMLLQGEYKNWWTLPQDIQVTYLDPHDWGFLTNTFYKWVDGGEVSTNPNGEFGLAPYPDDYDDLNGCGLNTFEPPRNLINWRFSAVEGWKRKSGNTDVFYETYYQDAAAVGVNLHGRRVRGAYCKYLKNTVGGDEDCLNDQHANCIPDESWNAGSPCMKHGNVHGEWYNETIRDHDRSVRGDVGYAYSYLGGANRINARQVTQSADGNYDGYYKHFSHYPHKANPELVGMYDQQQVPLHDFSNEGFVSHFDDPYFHHYGWTYFNGTNDYNSSFIPAINYEAEPFTTNGAGINYYSYKFHSGRTDILVHDFAFVPPDANFLKFDLRLDRHDGNLQIWFDPSPNQSSQFQLIDQIDLSQSSPVQTSCNIDDLGFLEFCKFYVDITSLRNQVGRFAFIHGTLDSSTEPNGEVFLKNIGFEECYHEVECFDHSTGGGDMHLDWTPADPHFSCSTPDFITTNFKTHPSHQILIRASGIGIYETTIVNGSAITFSTDPLESCEVYTCEDPEGIILVEQEEVELRDVSVQNKDDSHGIIQNEIDDQTRYSIFPNPVTSAAILELELEEKSIISLYLTDVSGKVFNEQVVDKKVDKGVHNFDLNMRSFAPGAYFVNVIIDGKLKSEKIIRL